MFFFTVVREFPKWVVPQMAPKVAGSDKMIVAKTNVLQFDPAKRRVCAALDDADGSNDEELLVISPETLSVAEWKTLRTWRSDQSLTYSIGLSVPAGPSEQALQELLPDLVRTQAVSSTQSPSVGADQYHLLKTDTLHDAKLGILMLLFSKGFVENVAHTVASARTREPACGISANAKHR